MTLPLAVTTITVRRPPAGDPYEPATAPVIATGVRAVIGSPSGSERRIGGQLSEITDVLNCDVTDLDHRDLVDDEVTGESYSVEWVRKRIGLGLDHVKAGLRQTKGGSSG